MSLTTNLLKKWSAVYDFISEIAGHIHNID